MKQIIIISLFIASFSGNAAVKNNLLHIDKTVASDTLLVNIQTKIMDAFVVAVKTKKTTEILILREKLKNLYQEKEQNLLLYWQSYLQYFLSLSYLILQDKKLAEKAIDKGIEILENMENKNSEEYALLANSQNFSIQFKRMKAMFISQDVKENANKSIALDNTNLRAYYVLGSNDFHTPKIFGGGKKAEAYFKKAISLPSQKKKNPYLLSWGKDDAYLYLIRFYIREKQWENAKKYFKEGTTLFPNKGTITKLASQLEGK